MKMSFSGEQRINLTALKRIDPSITEIVEHASQVALYKFNNNEWEKTEIEGTLFIYTRTQAPQHGFIVINRLSTQNLNEPITSGMEFQLQTPFLLYKNSTGQINGIWFYDKTECSKIEIVLNRVSEVFIQRRQRSVSESDKKHRFQNNSTNNNNNNNNNTMNNGDILALLHQAQEEYDKLQSSKNKGSGPKPLLVQPLSSHSHDLIKPTPVRAFNGLTPKEVPQKEAPKSPVSLSLASLFAQASQHQNNNNNIINSVNTKLLTNVKEVPLARLPDPPTPQGPFKLQQLFSNPENTLEHIEKQQLNEQQKEEGTVESETLPLMGAKVRNRATSCSSQMGLFSVGQATNMQGLQKADRQTSLEPSSAKSLPITIPPLPNSLETTLMTPDMFEIKVPATVHSPSLSPNFGVGSLDSLSQSLLSPLVFSKRSPPSVPNGKVIHVTPNISHLGGSRSTKQLPLIDDDVDSLQDSSQGNLLNTRISSSNAVALTKDQLRESLLYLLQNDDSFLNKIHEGYLASLNSHLART